MAGKRACLALAAVSLAFAGSLFARGPWRASEGNTSGWHLMTPEERIEHQARIRGFKSYDDCHAYELAHHELMVARASAQGLQLPAHPRDFCEQLRSQPVDR
ncbi:MAG TPA: hypothetical protein PLO14_13365 [Accumulibacter sp.]|uniref:hypothetical protein n=1 Tax=Accumulibacter sp. TaxID=2053492 RepID=UPI0025D621DC|nr:hypothetical protein [Accumulibacter sp.]MCM8599082.1 hypothetical protein [Accumulibacter sp.]HNC53205.1 hypothetical protein [Accumulibacter sp.]